MTRRRPPAKAATPVSQLNGVETKESLSESLKLEAEQKEQLLLQVQDKEATISSLTTENNNLSSALSDTETRLNELYAEQSRWEQEIAQRIEVADKLREQVREVEKEKRDIQRRYNEQTSSFEAERQAFYDNEQHLKSRIQSLTQARKRAETRAAEALAPVETIPAEQDNEALSVTPQSVAQKSSSSQPALNDPDNEPAEMTALKLELSTLSTSYTSIQSTLLLLQSQLVDLKRVNQELQEENESYMILLREKTLSGQFDLMRQVGGNSSNEDSEDDTNGDLNSLHSTTRSMLDRVDEEPEHLPEHMPDSSEFGDLEAELSRASSRNSKQQLPSKPGRRRTASTSAPRGESLADLPVAGPGLDLAAELGRAENKDILEGNYVEPEDNNKSKRPRKSSKGYGQDESTGDVEALRSEVKNLKDANKALSLYASKIIDRIIAQEGFEHVLAADYETPKTPAPAKNTPQPTSEKARPQSAFLARPSAAPPTPTTPTFASPAPAVKPPNPKRRSMSFDWKSFSFGGGEKKPEPSANLRPLTLQPGASPVVTGARKLETMEDEEDRKERERLTATMKLMGIQPQPSIHSPGIARTQQMEGTQSEPPKTAPMNRRFSLSLWGSKPAASETTPDQASMHSAQSSTVGLGLTHDVLEHVEAQNSLAALDAREKNLTQEIANGGSGGFTEPQRRVGRRGRRSAGGSGSGSTVWSAGLTDE